MPDKFKKIKQENLEVTKIKRKTAENIIKEEKTAEQKEKSKNHKKQSIINGRNLSISTKYSVAVCNFIRNKNIEKAISELEKVKKMKKAIPLKGEIPHKKGIMSGRYMINTVNEFIKLLNSLKANALVDELELEKVKIACKANIASRPYKRFGRGRFKRTNIQIKLIPIIKKLKGGKYNINNL